MTWSYSGDPASSTRDAVRFLAEDTIEAEPHLQDEEIDWLIAQWEPVHGDVYRIAAEVAEAISGRYAREVTASGDGASVDLAALQAKYRDLAVALRHRAMERHRGAVPYAGGVDIYDPVDFSTKPKAFGVGHHDNTRAGAQIGESPYSGVELDHYASGP